MLNMIIMMDSVLVYHILTVASPHHAVEKICLLHCFLFSLLHTVAISVQPFKVVRRANNPTLICSSYLSGLISGEFLIKEGL